MTSIEKAARALCRANGQSDDALSGDGPTWKTYLSQVEAVIAALREPSQYMVEAGAEIIGHVGLEESDTGYQSDAANVWRLMIDAIHSDSAHP